MKKDIEPGLIRLTGIGRIFATDELETHAVSDINLEIKKGEYVSITGPSGGGKSTLLGILGLLDEPSSGEYWLKGRNVANISRRERTRLRNEEIGFIFQAFNLIGSLSVQENVELPLTYRTDLTRQQRQEMAKQSLERVGMLHRSKHYPSQLSGGQQQRVAVARALAGNPAVLLADEPTGNLDSRNGETIMTLLRELHDSGATICMVTHDPKFAKIAQRSIYMFDGRIVDEENFELMNDNQSAPHSYLIESLA